MTIESRSGKSGSDLITSELGARPREVFRHLVEAYLTLSRSDRAPWRSVCL
jgi:hypothetical protein